VGRWSMGALSSGRPSATPSSAPERHGRLDSELERLGGEEGEQGVRPMTF